jgi:hypothetical protein
VGSRVGDGEAGTDEDAVERPDRIARRKARPAVGDPEMVAEIAEKAAGPPPFVAVAHQHGRKLRRLHGELREDRADLRAPPQAGDVEMHADDAKLGPGDAEVGEHRAARLQHRQVQHVVPQDLHPVRDKNGIAMPAEASGPDIIGNGPVAAVPEHQRQRHRGEPRSETAVGFLEGEDVGADFLEHGQRPFGAAAPVGSDRLADIVAAEENHLPLVMAWRRALSIRKWGWPEARHRPMNFGVLPARSSR